MSPRALLLGYGAALFVLALPFALRLVPPNRYFGLAFPGLVADRSRWLAIHEVAGMLFAAAGATIAGLGAWGGAPSHGLAAMLVVPVASATLGTLVHAARQVPLGSR